MFNDMPRAMKSDFFVSSTDDIHGLTQRFGTEPPRGGERAGNGTFHITTAPSVKSTVSYSRIERTMLSDGPGLRWDDVGVAEIRDPACTRPQFPDDVGFRDTVLIRKFLTFDLKAK